MPGIFGYSKEVGVGRSEVREGKEADEVQVERGVRQII